MSLTELIEGVEAHEKTLRVFNAEPSVVDALSAQFGDRNLTVTGDATRSERPASFVVLSQDGEFVTAARVEAVLADEPTGASAPESDAADPGTEDGGVGPNAARPILDHLDETMFTSYDTRQMIAASREIEDRAWRRGSGSIHAGFQTLSILRSELAAYERLAEADDLAVHAYAAPDADVPDHDSDLTVHVERSEEIRRSWFVVFDGGGVDVDKCALLAQERDPRSFYGFWTYDPDTVDWLVDYLGTAYGLVEQ